MISKNKMIKQINFHYPSSHCELLSKKRYFYLIDAKSNVHIDINLIQLKWYKYIPVEENLIIKSWYTHGHASGKFIFKQ